MKQQFELPKSEEVFNLSPEHGADPWRIERERIAEEERRQQAAEYQRKMQRTLEECPGFVGADAPTSPNGKGMVVVEPGRICEAWAWLKRRYHVCESLELSTDQGIAVKIAPRQRRKASGVKRVKVSFAPAFQFELAL